MRVRETMDQIRTWAVALGEEAALRTALEDAAVVWLSPRCLNFEDASDEVRRYSLLGELVVAASGDLREVARACREQGRRFLAIVQDEEDRASLSEELRRLWPAGSAKRP